MSGVKEAYFDIFHTWVFTLHTSQLCIFGRIHSQNLQYVTSSYQCWSWLLSTWFNRVLNPTLQPASFARQPYMPQPAQYVDVDARPRAHASHTGFALPLPSPPHNYHPQQRWYCQFCCMDRSIPITCIGSDCSSTGFGDSSQYSWTQLCEVYTIYALRNCMISIILIR